MIKYRDITGCEQAVHARNGPIEVISEVDTIDTVRSLTWDDRQWQAGSPSNWTWFKLRLDSTYGSNGAKMPI